MKLVVIERQLVARAIDGDRALEFLRRRDRLVRAVVGDAWQIIYHEKFQARNSIRCRQSRRADADWSVLRERDLKIGFVLRDFIGSASGQASRLSCKA